MRGGKSGIFKPNFLYIHSLGNYGLNLPLLPPMHHINKEQ